MRRQYDIVLKDTNFEMRRPKIKVPVLVHTISVNSSIFIEVLLGLNNLIIKSETDAIYNNTSKLLIQYIRDVQ